MQDIYTPILHQPLFPIFHYKILLLVEQWEQPEDGSSSGRVYVSAQSCAWIWYSGYLTTGFLGVFWVCLHYFCFAVLS